MSLLDMPLPAHTERRRVVMPLGDYEGPLPPAGPSEAAKEKARLAARKAERFAILNADPVYRENRLERRRIQERERRRKVA